MLGVGKKEADRKLEGDKNGGMGEEGIRRESKGMGKGKGEGEGRRGREKGREKGRGKGMGDEGRGWGYGKEGGWGKGMGNEGCGKGKWDGDWEGGLGIGLRFETQVNGRVSRMGVLGLKVFPSTSMDASNDGLSVVGTPDST